MSEIKNPLDPLIFPLPRSEWSPDDKHRECMSCDAKFEGGVFRTGKHHCRKCGYVVCKKCCKMRIRKHMVCKHCYANYKKYESVFTPTMIIDIIPINKSQSKALPLEHDESYKSYSYSYSYSDSDSDSHSLLIFDESPRFVVGKGVVSVAKLPLIVLDAHEDSQSDIDIDIDINIDKEEKEKEKEKEKDINININNISDMNININSKQIRHISYSSHFVANNLEGDIMHNQLQRIEIEPLKYNIGLLKLHIEELQVYTDKVKQFNEKKQLINVEWPDDEIGFIDIYENIVANEYDIRSLCELILSSLCTRNQLKNLQTEYNFVLNALQEKEKELTTKKEKENELINVLNEYELNDQENLIKIKKLQQEIKNNQLKQIKNGLNVETIKIKTKTKTKCDKFIDGKEKEKEKGKEEKSLFAYEKCVQFRQEIVLMKKWIKTSKQNMRNLKTNFAENHQYLKLKLTKFSEIAEDLYYERQLLCGEKKKFDNYLKNCVSKINGEEFVVAARKKEIAILRRKYNEKEKRISEREVLFEKSKKEFDIFCRKYNERKIENELVSAQLFSRKTLEIEKKEREIADKLDDLQLNKQYLAKQSEIFGKERELIHQQQHHLYLNEKELKKRKDLFASDASYIQREYLDSKDRFENDRFVLLDKINKLETDFNRNKLDLDSSQKQLLLKQEMCINLQDSLSNTKKQLLLIKKEVNKFRKLQFNQIQEISNLKQEFQINKHEIIKFKKQEKENDTRNLKEFKQFNCEKMALQNKNTLLSFEIKQLRDDMEFLKIKYKHRQKDKDKKKKARKSKIKKKQKINSKLV